MQRRKTKYWLAQKVRAIMRHTEKHSVVYYRYRGGKWTKRGSDAVDFYRYLADNTYFVEVPDTHVLLSFGEL